MHFQINDQEDTLSSVSTEASPNLKQQTVLELFDRTMSYDGMIFTYAFHIYLLRVFLRFYDCG